jgi:hypothetical protein
MMTPTLRVRFASCFLARAIAIASHANPDMRTYVRARDIARATRYLRRAVVC